MRSVFPIGAVGFLLACLLAGGTASGTSSDDLRERVNAAVERAIDFLVDRQLLDGSYTGWADSHRGGVTALVAYALLRSGVPPEHPTILRALAWLETQPPDRTYTASALLLALAATGRAEHLPWMERAAALLVEWMPPSGLWSYPGQHEDLSNTLFVALALDHAADRGVQIHPDTWRALLEGTLSCRCEEARASGKLGGTVVARGFGYRPGDEACGSMTAAGVTILEICARRLGPRLPGVRRRALEQARGAAVAWLSDSFTFERNPPERSWHFFHIWGYERVGSLLRLERIGGHDWYREGAEFLLRNQKKAGNWYADIDPRRYDPGGEGMAEMRTAIALLFLTRATAGVTSQRSLEKVYTTGEREDGLRLRGAGDTPLALWIEGAPAGTRDVAYVARLVGDGGAEAIPIGRSESAEDGFAIRREFPRCGKWEIRAAIGTPAGAVELGPLAVSIERVVEPRFLTYASDATRNAFAAAEGVEIEASSFVDEARGPARAFDRLQATYWECAATDGEPRIEIRLRRPVLGGRLLFSHPRNRRFAADLARATRIEVTVNGRHRFEGDLPIDAGTKGELDLPRNVPVQSVEVRIRAVAGGALGRDPVGFGEIELQRRDD